jgi:hypothetical protein
VFNLVDGELSSYFRGTGFLFFHGIGSLDDLKHVSQMIVHLLGMKFLLFVYCFIIHDTSMVV